MCHRSYWIEHNNAAVINNLLKLRRSLGASVQSQVGLAPHVNGIKSSEGGVDTNARRSHLIRSDRLQEVDSFSSIVQEVDSFSSIAAIECELCTDRGHIADSEPGIVAEACFQ